MKRIGLILLVLLCLAGTVSAEKARYLNGDSRYHVTHLEKHTGLIDCRISANYLKVRTSPGGANVLGHVEQADTIELIELSGNWAHIRCTYSAPTSPDSWVGLEGWVDADYVECPCNSNDYRANNFDGTYPEGTVDSSGVNVRELPGSNKRSLFTVNRGTDVVILGGYMSTDGMWFYRILTNGRTGFVRQDLISYTGTSTTPYADEGIPSHGGIGANPGMPTYIPSGAVMGELLHDSTNVRQSANGTVSGRLRRGTVVAILSDTRDREGTLWYYVSYGNDLRGYIRADLVNITGYGQPTYPNNYYAPTSTPVPYYYNYTTPIPYYYYATPSPTATPAPTAVPSYGNNVDYNSIYNAYIRSAWVGGPAADRTLIRDIDGDGVPELFVWADDGARPSVYLYTYKNGYVIPLNLADTPGTSTTVAGSDRNTNGIGGGGEVYFPSYGIGILAGGSNSASESIYTYYLKNGYALIPVQTLTITWQDAVTVYTMDGRPVSEDTVRQYLTSFNALSIIQ